tara:strand:+ start:116 stop:547 length:432 start_codon:yes stop_codon:yes gene_type:complete
MNKKISVLCCVIGAIALTYGGMNFEFQGIPSPLTAITVSISLALGATMFLYGLYSFFKSKPTTANKGEKPMMTAKQLEKANKKKEKKTANDTSVGLMKREKELETRRKELESLLAEAIKEEKAVEKMLIEKGWVQKNGSWGIE